jgi:glycosyltransferase involved in cell wall biosynthesis
MKKNVLILYNNILHYRIPFFNLLAEHYNVKVLHSGKKCVCVQDKFEEIIVPSKRIGPFIFQKGVLEETMKEEYDVIIAFFDVRLINTLISISRHNRHAKFILWGAWITKNYIANQLRIYYLKKGYTHICYTQKSFQDFVIRGVDPKNLFVANNSFHVVGRTCAYENSEKTLILFVGSLDQRKQNEILLQSFSDVIDKISTKIVLTIIGDGEQKTALIGLANKLLLNDRINFVGTINEPEILADYYKKAIVSVSFGQAGLSVLQSFAFGVPFMTKNGAISGGEITNIKHGFNGILCSNQLSLSENIIDLCNNMEHARELGKNAFDHYTKYCTMVNMVQGFQDSIEGTRFAIVDEV